MAIGTVSVAATTAQPPDLAMPDGKRRQILEERFKANTSRGKFSDAPYAGVRIKTGGELLWILHQRGWAAGFPPQPVTFRSRVRGLRGRELEPVSPGTAPADLRYVDLHEVALTGVNLGGAKLQGANLRGAVLRRAILVETDLRGAQLAGADLSDAQLLPEEQEREWERRFPTTATPPSRSCAGVEVRTRNELLWLLRRYGWLSARTPEERAQVDLRDINLQHADLFDADVEGYNLEDATLISDDRSDEVAGQIAANRATGRPPLAGVEIRTRRELLWLKLKEGWSGAPTAGSGGPSRADLREAVLSGGDFVGARLFGANLRHAHLDGADLSMAELSNANLSQAEMTGTTLDHANLTGARLPRARLYDVRAITANLFEADLRGAELVQAGLCGSSMSVADLRGADCREADLRGVDLRGLRVDAGTSFIDLLVDSDTSFGDIVWYGLPLLQINWKHVDKLGDEQNLTREGPQDDVIRAYRELSNIQRRQGFYADASRLRLRQKWIERRVLRRQGHYAQWLTSWLSNVLIGYGERSGRIAWTFLFVIVMYGGAYYLLARFGLPLTPASVAGQLSVGDAVKLSLSSLLGRQAVPDPLLREHLIGAVISLIATSETIAGWLMLTAITVLVTRQLLGESTSSA